MHDKININCIVNLQIDYEKLKIFTSKTLQIIHICLLLSIFGRKIAKSRYRIAYSIPILRSFKGVFQGVLKGDLAAEIERENGSFKRAFPPSTSGCQWRDPAVARMSDTPRPFLYIIDIACARVIIIALVSRKTMPPRRAAYRSHFTLRKSFVRRDESRIAYPLPSPRCRRCPTNPARSRRCPRSPPCAPCACSWAKAAPLATART